MQCCHMQAHPPFAQELSEVDDDDDDDSDSQSDQQNYPYMPLVSSEHFLLLGSIRVHYIISRLVWCAVLFLIMQACHLQTQTGTTPNRI